MTQVHMALAELTWCNPEEPSLWIATDDLVAVLPGLAPYTHLVVLPEQKKVVPIFRHWAIVGCRYGWSLHPSTLGRLVRHDIPLALALQPHAHKALQKLGTCLHALVPTGANAPSGHRLTPPSSSAALLFAGVAWAIFKDDDHRRDLIYGLDNAHCVVLHEPASWDFLRLVWTRNLPAAVIAPMGCLIPGSSAATNGQSVSGPLSVTGNIPPSPVTFVDAPETLVVPGHLMMGAVMLKARIANDRSHGQLDQLCFVWPRGIPETRWERLPDLKRPLGLWAILPALLPVELWWQQSPHPCWKPSSKTFLKGLQRVVQAIDQALDDPGELPVARWVLAVDRLVRPDALVKEQAGCHISVVWYKALLRTTDDDSTLVWVPRLEPGALPSLDKAQPKQTRHPTVSRATLLASRGMAIQTHVHLERHSSPVFTALDLCSKAELDVAPMAGAWNLPLGAVTQGGTILQAVQRALRAVGVKTCIVVSKESTV